MDANIRESIPAAARNLIGLFFIFAAFMQISEAAKHIAASGEADWFMLVKSLLILVELTGAGFLQ